MKNLIVTCLMMCALTALPACKSVVSEHLIGEPVDAEHAQALEGIWRMDDGILHIKHLEGGKLIVAGLDWEDETFKLTQLRITVTIHQDTIFAQMVAEEYGDEDEANDADDPAADPAETGEKPWLLIGMLASSDRDTLVIYGPNHDRFKQALEAGQLNGQIEDDGNTTHIQGEKAALDAFLEPDLLHELFRFDDPGVLVRIGDLN